MKLNAEQINKIKEIAEEYDFDYAAIGFRNAYEYGEDEGEYIIRDPEVIAIIA